MESQNFKQSQHVIFLDTANNEPIKVWIADLSYRTFDHIESKVIQSAQDIERLTNALDEFEFSAPLVDQAQTFSASFGIQVELCLVKAQISPLSQITNIGTPNRQFFIG